MLTRMIEDSADFLRERLGEDSRTLRRMTTAWYRASTLVRGRPSSRRRWAEAEGEFSRLVDAEDSARPDFFVLQIGACDGLVDDPIHDHLMMRGWHALLVEPQRAEFQRLRAVYDGELDRIALANVAVSHSSGVRPIFRVDEAGITSEWQRGLASFYRQHLPPGLPVVEELVECVTFDDLVHRYSISRIDLLQIDVEGYDFEILKMIDFSSEFAPSLIRFEHRHLRRSEKAAAVDLLEAHGYRTLEMEFDMAAARRTGVAGAA